MNNDDIINTNKENIIIIFSNDIHTPSIKSYSSHNINIFKKGIYEFTKINDYILNTYYISKWYRLTTKYTYCILMFTNELDLNKFLNNNKWRYDTFTNYQELREMYDNYDDFLKDYIDRIKNMRST